MCFIGLFSRGSVGETGLCLNKVGNAEFNNWIAQMLEFYLLSLIHDMARHGRINFTGKNLTRHF